MGYMLPLKFVRVSPDMSVCATRIVAIMSTHALQCRKLITEEKKAGTLLNAAGRDKVRSAIIFDNGSVVASPYSIGSILNNISKAGMRSSTSKKIRLSSGLKLYDVLPDEIFDEEIEETPEMQASDNEPECMDEEEPGLVWDGDGDEE